MTGTGRAAVAAMVASLAMALGSVDGAPAIGLCDCCAKDMGGGSCAAACSGKAKAPGQCTAIIDYAGKGAASDGRNPLNGISLRELSVGNPTPGELETFRRFLEAGRRRAIADYNRALWRLKHRRIDQAKFDAAKALYKEALVNYYHGIHAYLNKVGAKSD
jgi:hypothetical protein